MEKPQLLFPPSPVRAKTYKSDLKASILQGDILFWSGKQKKGTLEEASLIDRALAGTVDGVKLQTVVGFAPEDQVS